MGATVDCYITSPKSQNYLADDEKSLLAGVVLAAPAFFITAEAPKPPSGKTKGLSQKGLSHAGLYR